MPEKLDGRFLERECLRELADTDARLALRIAHTLGPLASRWLAAKARSLAGIAAEPPRLPATAPPGAFHVLVALRGEFPALRPAFTLPLRWVRGTGHSPKLPPALLEHAEEAIAIHRAKRGAGSVGQWSLRLDCAENPDFDLSGIAIEGPSAAASMLAALDLAHAEIGAIGTVLASAACTGGAWSRVEGVGAKLDAAVASGATCVFLSDRNKAEADAWQAAAGRTGFVRYLRAEADLWESLAPLLEEFGAPPLPDAPLSDHANYYQRALSGTHRGDKRRDYYLQVLIDPLSRMCRDHPGVTRIPGPVYCLVGCVTPSMPPTLTLLARLLCPRKVRLVHSPLAKEKSGRLAANLAAIERHLRGEHGVESVEPWELDLYGLPLESLTATLRDSFAAIVGHASRAPIASPLVVDVTNGPKRLSLAMLEAAPAAVACLLVDSQQGERGAHMVGTERIEWLDHSG